MNSAPASAAQLATLPIAATDLSRGAKAAREFEGSLIASLLQSLEETFAAVPGKTDLPGADDYNYLGTQALASAIADHGGFGIAKMILAHLPAHEGKGAAGDSSLGGQALEGKAPVSPADRMK
jgi:Rod binding domain-containing protein